MKNLRPICLSLVAALMLPATGLALDSQTSDGPVSLVDEPVFRIPRMTTAPTIDGVFDENEWADSSAVAAFWSSNVNAVPYPRYQHLAPHQIQSKVHAGYDKENLFIAYIISTYPNNAWVKARGRFPDVYNHPRYGIMQDDHIEFELRPLADLARGYQLGFFKWFANPIGVISDQYYSQAFGQGKRWQSQATVRAGQTAEHWVVEMQIPFKEMLVGPYGEKDEQGQDIVKLPPPDGTTYRSWFKNGIGGASSYVVLYDQHTWRETKTRLVLDSQAVSFQMNDIGPFMEDIIDVALTLKNHNTRSETVQLGFFVENAEGLIYSSYEDEATNGGLVELRPGESRQLQLKRKFPGITGQMNFLWFDIRSSGHPAKILYQNRLAEFHSTDPGPPYDTWRREKLETINNMRPPKKDFDFRFQYSPYQEKLSGVVDLGIHGASKDAKSATEAKLTLSDTTEEENQVLEHIAPVHGDFATFLIDVPDLPKGEYRVSLLLFDANKRIVGEYESESFTKSEFPWEHNRLGLDDTVWTPFVPLRVDGRRLETLKHTITLDETGLPAQIAIKPDLRELPLEQRQSPEQLTATELAALGRGPQLRSPLRLEVEAAGQRQPAEVITAAECVRTWQSELQYKSKLKVGPLDVDLDLQYDCDGSLTGRLTYGSAAPAEIDLLELVMEVAGPVDMRVGGMYGMQPASGVEVALPDTEGIVWDSARHEDLEPFELFYSRFVPYFHFGNGDRAWSWFCDSDAQWLIDRDGSTMTLERDAAGAVTWRIKFVNHSTTVDGSRTIEFALFTHPTKNKEREYRRVAWIYQVPVNYGGLQLECLPNDGPWGIDGSDATFEFFRKRYPTAAPRLYIVKNWINSGIPELQKRAYTGEWLLDQNATVDSTPIDKVGGYGQPWVRRGKGLVMMEWGGQSWEDYFVWHCERMARLGRVPGFWWDETFPPPRTECIANGQAYLRDPQTVQAQELPWQANFGSLHLRNLLKRHSRLLTENKIPNYNAFWATSSACFEAFGRHSTLTESAGGTSDFALDHVIKYPQTFMRHMANTNKGLTTNILPLLVGLKGSNLLPGDTLRMERAVLGRCLLHDIGEAGVLPDPEQLSRMLKILEDFGYFDDQTTEMLPYWRNRDICRYGEAFDTQGDFETTDADPYQHVYVTAYRRAYKTVGEVTGYKVMFVIMNESAEDVRGRLHLLDSKRLFGEANNLLVSDVYRTMEYALPYPHLRNMVTSFHAERKALLDLERGGAITQATRGSTKLAVKDEIYGPLHVPAHDFRIVLGEFDPEPDESKQFDRAELADEITRRQRELYRLRSSQEQPWWETWQTLTDTLRQKEAAEGR